MKKYIVYIAVLLIGLLLGWWLFGNPSHKEGEHDHLKVAETRQMWTCSMHPQIMQPEPGDCPICGMDLIPAETAADGLSADQFQLTDNAMALANIKTSIVGTNSGADQSIKLSGKIVENEEANVVQVSYFTGRIEQLNVSFKGEEVKKGQRLATIYSAELYAAQQELITAATLKESQPELYKAVRNKLKLWKLSEDQINGIEASGTVKENFPVIATVSGTVTDKLVEEGDYIKQGQPLFKIANLNTVWANLDVYENQIDLFKTGQDITITTHAYPGKAFKARVDFIDPILDSGTRTVKLRVVLDNKDGLLKPGMFVEGRIQGFETSGGQVLTIPKSAVLWTGERSVVYLKPQPDQPIFEMRDIILGKPLGAYYEVLGGLKRGDEIVTNGTFTVDAAAQLQGKKSMMNKDGSTSMTGHEGHWGTPPIMSANQENYSNPNERITVSVGFQKQLKEVYEAYIQLKDALVHNDRKAVKDAAQGLMGKLDDMDQTELADTIARTHWMSLENELKLVTSSISKATALKAQRSHFKHLSSPIIHAIQIFGIGEKVYVEFCPMADNNKGAYWLSKEKKVINPYFGGAMLTCGEVKQIIE
ncbi:efflux RND transporter periplasmic adaptor subunit [Aestuariivivens sediminis]|uniref:efflux RND transporter periplasmic adaptor subunit n=1 Tax=Aestuariivivens sediminis TaxID=2913557 RepID=UPI001F577646|nr:efflux RND transporter periplasmic adaptor subunit [Aestuariivivens sediminis]